MTDSQSGQENAKVDCDELRKQIAGLFGNHLKSFDIETTAHGLVLHGVCDSFYIKQLVQEVVRKNSRQRIVLNALMVEDHQPNIVSDEQIEQGIMKNQTTLVDDEVTEISESDTDGLDATHHQVQHPQSPQGVSVPESAITISKPFNTIFHPSDFSEASKVAFAHALKIALAGKGILQMMHVDKHALATWEDFPSVRETLIRWNVLPDGSGRDAVEELGVSVNKVIASSGDPVKACIDYFEVHDVDLIVLSVHQRDGVMRWLGNIVGERISQGSKQNTLFIPVGQSGFVSQADGTVALDHILIPVVKKPRGEAAVRFVQDLIATLNLPAGKITLLHVGHSDTMPFVQHPVSNGWIWNRVRIEGDRTEEIVRFAKDVNAKLIVMTTDGPDRFLDGLRGTTSERVLRKAHCPVAVVPVESVID